MQLDSARPDLESLYLDLRPYMNRAPFTVRKDSSASRAHQVSYLPATNFWVDAKWLVGKLMHAHRSDISDP